MEARIDPTHLSETISLLEDIAGHQSATKQSILLLIGKLHFMCHVCRPSRAFLHCMIETSMKAWHLHAESGVCRDIDWWLCYLLTWNGVSLLYKSHWLTSMESQLFTDASDIGFGCYFQGHWCQGEFLGTCFWDGLMSINWRELYAVTMTLAIWGDQFKGKRFMVHCDNMSIVQIMAKCSSKSKSMMDLVCSLAMFGMQNNFDLHLQHIPGVNNGVVNALSRFNHDQFCHLSPDADYNMMPLVSFTFW